MILSKRKKLTGVMEIIFKWEKKRKSATLFYTRQGTTTKRINSDVTEREVQEDLPEVEIVEPILEGQ